MSKSHVFSLVANAATSDARVMKQARALRDAGYSVTLFGKSEPGLANEETVEGIRVRRFACYSGDHVSLDQIAEVAAFAPNVQDKIIAHASSMLSWKREFDSIISEKIAAKVELKTIVDAIPALKARKAKMRRWLWRDRVFRIFRRVGISIPLTRVSFKEASSNLDAAKASLEVTRKRVHEAQAREKALIGSIDKNADLFFSRHALFAANFLGLSFDETPAFIHCHDLYPLMGGVALAQRFGAKVIFDAHEIETERVPPLAPDRKQFIDLLERDLFKRTEQIVTCCDSSTEFYHERFPRRLPVVVMNAPEIGDAVVGDAGFDVRNAAGLSESHVVVIYTGGVGREARGLNKVAAALRLLPDYHLVVLGPRHPGNDAWLIEEARTFGVSDRIHLLPPVSPEQVVAAVRSADVGVCPIQDVSLSYRYAMPNKLFEMTFAELPMCVSDLPEMAKFVRELGVGLVMDERDPAAIASTLRSAVADRENFTLSPSARRILETKYSWKTQAEKLIGAYRDLDNEYV